MRSPISSRFRAHERLRRGDEIELHIGAPRAELSNGSSAQAALRPRPRETCARASAAPARVPNEHSGERLGNVSTVLPSAQLGCFADAGEMLVP
jgi:hypothetical protein